MSSELFWSFAIFTKLKIAILALLIICLYLIVGTAIFLAAFRFVNMPAIEFIGTLGLQQRNEELLSLAVSVAILFAEALFIGCVIRGISRGILRLVGKT